MDRRRAVAAVGALAAGARARAADAVAPRPADAPVRRLRTGDIGTLLLVPVLYSLVERRSEKKRLRAHPPVDPDATQPQPAV